MLKKNLEKKVIEEQRKINRNFGIIEFRRRYFSVVLNNSSVNNQRKKNMWPYEMSQILIASY